MEVNGGANQLIPRDRRPAALGDLRVLPDEVVCAILSFLSLRDVARLSCVSSVMYIFCNEEPLWMSLCLNNLSCHLEYKGSWKRTLLHQENVINVDEEPQKKPLHFDGFYSLFLYKRLYRCYTTLDGFYVDDGNVERKKDLSLEEFSHEYDGKKPVLLNGLADSWPGRNTWTIDQLVLNYGDTAFRISQRSSRKIRMQLKDYVSYMNLQHDEDPLYIFDEKFGEVAPGLLKDYNVPHLFREDFFDVLDMDQRPPFRWLIIGPERSGASWHVDPALTSAWNTLLCGRKRWALYPPGKVPLGVTVHVNEEDGDVNIDTPTSMQWWLEFYPLLPDEDKPIECTQMPGETIFVPSGWWHCVLNLELTIAVTQNFVNFKNFEYVCLDMAPGYRQKGVCRAGLLALDSGSIQDMKDVVCSNSNHLTSSELPRIGKRLKMQNPGEDPMDKNAMCCEVWNHEFPYDIHFLSKFLDKEIDHYNSAWSSGNCIGQRDLRAWLWKLWVGKPGMRDLIWKGACLALSAGKWVECVGQICKFHGLCSPADAEKMPVGTGSNPVYLVSDIVIKIYVEEGLENSLYCLGTELEFYDMLCNAKSPLKEHVPKILASGLIFLDNGSYRIVPWDGRVLPDIIDKYGLTEELMDYSFPFGVWSKKLFEYRKAQTSFHEPISSATSTTVWPYIVTERCKGKIFAELRESISSRDALNLASFLGEQLRNLHCLPLPSLENSAFSRIIQKMDGLDGINVMEVDADSPGYAAEWEIFIRNLAIKRKDVLNRLTKWGDPIPKRLIEKVSEYLPSDFGELHYVFKGKTCSWIHSDIMDDNIHMEPSVKSDLVDGHMGTGTINGTLSPREGTSWKTSHVLDFSDLSIGDLILDLIPIHLDIFRGDAKLLKQLLASYLLPVVEKVPEHCLAHKDTKFMRPSYRAMCYCILHEENVLGAIFSLWEELRMANSWDGVESHVWGILNEYTGLL